MAWRRAIVASFMWLVANAVAGAAFAFAAQPFLTFENGFFFIASLLAGFVFGVAQWLALRPFFRDVRNDELSLKLSFLWIPASVIGGALFYVCYYWGAGALGAGTGLNYYLTASPSEWIFLGSLGYAVVTVPCVALLVAVAGRKSAPKPALVTP
jgi:hypothetical protein